MFERKKQAGKIYFLPIDQIRPSPFQARREFSEQELAALALSLIHISLRLQHPLSLLLRKRLPCRRLSRPLPWQRSLLLQMCIRDRVSRLKMPIMSRSFST